MVQNSRKTLHTDTVRLRTPEPIQVQEDPCGSPFAVKTTRRQVIRLAQIEDRWRLDDEWWRSEPISRLYYTVLLASGPRLVIYKDLADGSWYRQV